MDIAEAERLIRKCKNVARQMGDQLQRGQPNADRLWDQLAQYNDWMSRLPPGDIDKEVMKGLEDTAAALSVKLAELPLQQMQAGGQPPPNITINNPQAARVEKPKLREVTHDGKVETFHAFWTVFGMTVINNNDLSEQEKCRYLLAAVLPEDAQLIAGSSLQEMGQRLEKKYKSRAAVEKLVVMKAGRPR